MRGVFSTLSSWFQSKDVVPLDRVVIPEGEQPAWLRPGLKASLRPSLRQLGPYLIDSTLGSGGMATVYRAIDRKHQRTVALKVVHQQADFIQRFQRELEISQRLRHPNLVEVYFGGVIQGQLCLVMEWVDGLGLDDILLGGPLPLEDFPLLACQLASGLQSAHNLNIIHRDIKPANVIVARDGTLKLLDFGLALADGHERLTVNGYAMGTPTYMAPEGLTQGVCDTCTDQYALGVVFYQILTGRCPFEGEPVDVARAHIEKRVPRLSEFRAEIPRDWQDCVLRMLSKNPQERFPDLTQVRRFLSSALVAF
ncbi:serine/threonine protein kinase [bacterium]|nr:serine/threonine protein kinase [bacterium]